MAAKKKEPSKKEIKLKAKLDDSKNEVKELKKDVTSLKRKITTLENKLKENDVETIDDEFLNLRLTVGDLHPSILVWFNDPSSQIPKNSKSDDFMRRFELVC